MAFCQQAHAPCSSDFGELESDAALNSVALRPLGRVLPGAEILAGVFPLSMSAPHIAACSRLSSSRMASCARCRHSATDVTEVHFEGKWPPQI